MSGKKEQPRKAHLTWAHFAGYGITPQKHAKGISWKEFENTFRLAFGREMTLDERRWFELSRLIEDNSDQQEESSQPER